MTIERPVETSTADLLQAARAALEGDEPVAAYQRAIRAIEQAFRQIATPDNPTDDLGVILAHYEDRPDLWNAQYLRISRLEPIMAMIDHLWRRRPQPDDQFQLWPEEAQIAVTIAESVVNLAEQGFFELLDELTPEEEAEDLRRAEEYLERKRRGVEEESIPWEEVKRRLDTRWQDE